MVQLGCQGLFTLWAATNISLVLADGQGSFLWEPAYANEANVYARVIELQHAGPGNGKLLATWEHWYANNTENAAFPNGTEVSFIIRESEDGGETWTTLTTVYDSQTGPGHPCARFWQPFFFEFPHQIGNYSEGTLLLVGNLVPTNKSFTSFFTWRSTDHGHTWNPVGAWQEGGTTTAGIWEPFLYLDKQGALVAAFSDERSAATHSQMLVHVVSHDGGDTWGDVVRTVASDTQTDRPGMPTVALMDNGEYLMAYEICGWDPLRCPIHVKKSPDGITWNAADLGTAVVSEDGRYAGSSPYTIWDSSSKQLLLAPHNTWDITTNARTPEAERSVYINKQYGVGAWSWAPSPWAVSYASTACNSNYSPHMLLRSNGTIRYTAPTSQGPAGFCAVRTGQAPIGVLPYRANFAANGQLGWIDTGAAGAGSLRLRDDK
ncbi:neuraminidase [Thozetella sp. PMI_491]|nr:neuraminidase [Thozetella sp. PMI_491]